MLLFSKVSEIKEHFYLRANDNTKKFNDFLLL